MALELRKAVADIQNIAAMDPRPEVAERPATAAQLVATEVADSAAVDTMEKTLERPVV